jgi:hypothetical protein
VFFFQQRDDALIPDIERKIIQSADIRSEDRRLIVSMMKGA